MKKKIICTIIKLIKSGKTGNPNIDTIIFVVRVCNKIHGGFKFLKKVLKK